MNSNKINELKSLKESKEISANDNSSVKNNKNVSFNVNEDNTLSIITYKLFIL